MLGIYKELGFESISVKSPKLNWSSKLSFSFLLALVQLHVQAKHRKAKGRGENKFLCAWPSWLLWPYRADTPESIKLFIWCFMWLHHILYSTVILNKQSLRASLFLSLQISFGLYSLLLLLRFDLLLSFQQIFLNCFILFSPHKPSRQLTVAAAVHISNNLKVYLFTDLLFIYGLFFTVILKLYLQRRAERNNLNFRSHIFKTSNKKQHFSYLKVYFFYYLFKRK